MTKQNEEFAQGQARILSNTTYLLAASIIQKFISLGFFVYFVRILGPKDTGLFVPIRNFIPIALVIIDFSLSVVLTREIARTPHRVREFVNSVLSVKMLIAIIVLLLTLGLNAAIELDQLKRTLLFIAGLVVGLDMFTMTYTAALRGLQIFRYEAIGLVLTQIATIITGVVALKMDIGIPSLMLAFLGGSMVNFLFMLTMIRRRIGFFPKLGWNSSIIRHFVVIALPIVGAALLVKIFTYTDQYLLLKNAGETAVGIYVAAHKAPFALEFVAAAFAASLLPAMSKYFIQSREQLGRVFEQAMRYLIIISVPIAVCIFVLARQFVVKLYGPQFPNATLPLQIMIAVLPLIFLNFPVGSFLIATNRQIWNIVNLGLAVAVNILLNLLLQPHLGATGAAISVSISYLVLFSLGMIQVNRVSKIDAKRVIATFGMAGAAALIMAIPLIFLQRTFSPYFLVIPAGLVYLAALFMLGGMKGSDVQLALRALSRKGQ